jgi:hypothetical protein
VWLACGDDKRWRGRRIGPRSLRGPGSWAPREERSRGGGRRGRGRRSGSRLSMGPKSPGPHKAEFLELCEVLEAVVLQPGSTYHIYGNSVLQGIIQLVMRIKLSSMFSSVRTSRTSVEILGSWEVQVLYLACGANRCWTADKLRKKRARAARALPLVRPRG